MIKNIIFDLGNVLLNYDPEEYLKTKITDTDKISEVYTDIFKSKEWALLDKGTITQNEAIDIIINRDIKNEKYIKLAFDNWYELLTPIEGTVEILNELKNAQYKIYFLSNFHALAFEKVTSWYGFFKLFDGGVASFKDNLLKPEKEIYKTLLERYDLDPKESVFIDDTQVNIEGAAKLNINTILFKSPEALKENLRKLKVNLQLMYIIQA